MEENENFVSQLQNALTQKTEWFNTNRLQELISHYRIMQSCTKNLYDALVKKSLITPDPYRLDTKIQDIVVPETTGFSDAEANSILGARFSAFEVMIDWLCTYFRFTVDSITIPKVKKLLELNKVFDWENMSPSNPDSNTHALANVINQSKNNTPSVIISMITDCVERNAQSVRNINRILNELGSFQKELYKFELRKNLFDHPEFNKTTAYASADAEMAEIKRLYVKVMGKRPFYSDLIKEIIQEDIGPEKDKLRENLLKRLEIKTQLPSSQRKVEKVSFRDMLMATVISIGVMAPTLSQLKMKLGHNFDLAFHKELKFFGKLLAALRKVFHVKETERICSIQITDPKTGSTRTERINVGEFMIEINKKERLYSALAVKGPEYERLAAMDNDSVLQFVNKQISETQSLFSKINALDAFFKSAVDVMQASKVKGMQIELSALRNSIIAANKKRSDYSSAVEEAEQMKRLGISEND